MKKKLFDKIYRLHINVVKDLNNSYIFLQKVIPIIERECRSLKGGDKLIDKTYQVPSRKEKVFTKEAFRTDIEVKQILELVARTGLYENTLVTNVSKFESYLFDTLKEVLKKFPNKLSITVQGIGNYKDIPLQLIMQSESIDSLMNEIISNRIIMVSYATPQNYLRYFQEITGCSTDKDEFADYIEIKATRDLIIHNSGIINETYKTKVGEKSRGTIGDKIAVDKTYFDHSIATMKRISGLIRKDTEKAFGNVD